ncbi:carbamoyl phosphate synthase small subunit [Lentilactobacillus kosonis]|uniref:Carbamoyl phosphate synthase small chain n=1 Tax=Lentilactobacillus kosonis TaxID=2810561 RepID=A0A401FJ07_9LACO|nr:carbamoyl phosphate synthase small subunit [Lentilactobacillus kosonis]GAY72342.1 carbamoyl-phosphate synthase small chain [Lentilactobacillus kosonis]
MKKYLTLADGQTFIGEAHGDKTAEIEGELVFTTSMTGYQETITDPSYDGQIILFTSPLIGNYGVSEGINQSSSITARAVIVREMTAEVYHYQSKTTMNDFLKAAGVPAISGIDTRHLTKIIRHFGTMNASLTNQPVSYEQIANLSETSGFRTNITPSSSNRPVVVIDFGVKNNIVKLLQAQNVPTTVVSPNSTLADIKALEPSGILLSNGPGDPTDYTELLPTIQALQEKYPIFGICLGHQLLALANGATTYKLPFGHRGINHPVKDLTTGNIFITSQNHGYAVDVDSLANTPLELTAEDVNDKTCEGLQYPGKPVFSVQFHPEAAPGPHEATKLFNKFVNYVHGGTTNA